MPSEIVSIETELTRLERGVLEGFPYSTGRLGKRSVVVTVSGVGITAAAMTAALFVHRFRPAELVFTGSGARLNPEVRCGDIIVSERTAHHNAGSWTDSGMVYRKVRNALKDRMTPYEFRPGPELLGIAKAAMHDFPQDPITVDGRTYTPVVRTGRVCSGDVFGVTRKKILDIREKLRSDLIEMEGSAAAQVCWQLGVPHLVIRSGSNRAQPSPGDDYRRYGQIAAHQAARFTAHFVRRLARDRS